MFRILFILSVLVVLLPMEVRSEHYVKTWQISDNFGTVDTVSVDTAHLNFQLNNVVDRYSILNSYNANLGSPIQSKIFEERKYTPVFSLAEPYLPYMNTIENNKFYNTKSPFSNIYYLSGGSNYHEEEQISFLFTANANKDLNFGTKLDYIYTRGEYQNTAAKRFAGSFFGSYNGERYKAHGLISFNNLNNFENGGIKDTNYISGNIVYPAANIPVNIKAYSSFKWNQFFYTQQYSLGIFRKEMKGRDTLEVYVPVTKFFHTIRLDDMSKKYYEPAIEKEFYENTFGTSDYTYDSIAFQILTNRFTISMEEEFNKWMDFGLKAYIENRTQRYSLGSDTVRNDYWQSNTSIGGMLAKESGRVFKYNLLADLVLIGPHAGDMSLSAKIGGYFRLWRDSVTIEAHGSTLSESPGVFEEKYSSSHMIWDQSLEKVNRTRLGGRFAIPTRQLDLSVNIENIYKPIYFQGLSAPIQFAGNVQLLTADLSKVFKAGKFALDARAVYQLSSNQSVIPLPLLSAHLNLYYDDIWFKVLSMQMGVDAKYHSLYYAPSFNPSIGKFVVQNSVQIGNYPYVTVYLNAHLKRTRFFAEMSHINQMFMQGKYYAMPYYPYNPSVFKMGLSWNFYD